MYDDGGKDEYIRRYGMTVPDQKKDWSEFLLLKVRTGGAGCCSKRTSDVTYAVIQVVYSETDGRRIRAVELRAGFSKDLLKLSRICKWTSSVTVKGLDKDPEFVDHISKILKKGMVITS